MTNWNQFFLAVAGVVVQTGNFQSKYSNGKTETAER